MQQKKRQLLKPAEYARLRGLNRSTIARQIAEGKIPTTADGRIDPQKADAAREGNLDQSRRHQAERRKADRETPPTETRTLRDLVIAGGRAGAVAAICAPAEALAFARVARRVGCTPEQAWALGMWHTCAPALAVALTDDEINGLSDPSEKDWRALLGAFDIEAADDLLSCAVMPELQPGAECEEAATSGEGVSR